MGTRLIDTTNSQWCVDGRIVAALQPSAAQPQPSELVRVQLTRYHCIRRKSANLVARGAFQIVQKMKMSRLKTMRRGRVVLAQLASNPTNQDRADPGENEQKDGTQKPYIDQEPDGT